jgi:hypothetical protein
MKTPREVIFERHQAAEDKLKKAIQAEDLAAYARLAGKPGREPQTSFSFSAIVGQLWQDMFWPWRRVWAGVAAAWLVILGMALAAGGTPESRLARIPSPDPQVLAVLREQEKSLAQMLGRAAPPAIARPRTPGPRSAVEPPAGTQQNAVRPETIRHWEVPAQA